MNTVFYEKKDIKNHDNLSSKGKAEIILHFLAKVSETLILYETKQELTTIRDASSEKEILATLLKIIQGVDPSLALIKGKIREIYLSYSS